MKCLFHLLTAETQWVNAIFNFMVESVLTEMTESKS